MTEPRNFTSGGAGESLSDRIDVVCDAFERAWRSERRISLEDCLSDLSETDRPSYFRELLAIELELRSSQGDFPTAAEYVSRFPDRTDAVRLAFRQHRMSRGMPGSPNGSAHRSVAVFGGLATVESESVVAGRTSGGSAELRIAGYEILREIARGGMGVVYEARQPGVNRIVALKMTLAGQFASDEERRRFLAEAEAAGQLDHPHIVPIHEVGEHHGQPFFSMGYVAGRSLKALLAEGPLAPARAAQLVETIARAVHYAHGKGIVHRDLKPANVLIDPDGQPRVTDFGLAKRTATDSSLTATGQILGTPSFMPPEQAMGKLEQVGPLSDVYSLGATLYCLLTGRPPFQAASVVDTLMQVVEREPVAPRRLNPKIPIDLETICLKSLRKEPEKRYASAAALADDLERWRERRPILARPVGRLERLGLWCRRRPGVVAAGIGAIVLSAAALFAFGQQRDTNEAARSTTLVDAVATAPAEAVPYAVENLRPLSARAIPLLRERASDDLRPRSERLHAALALAEFGQVDAEFLVGSIDSAVDAECRNLVKSLSSRQTEATRLLQNAFEGSDPKTAAELRARLAIVALHLGEARLADEMSRAAEDPVPRHVFQKTLTSWNAGVPPLVEAVEASDRSNVRSAACLAIGHIEPHGLPQNDRDAGTRFLTRCFEKSPDAGTHSAAVWALRQWKKPLPAVNPSRESANAGWFVNRAGITMLRVGAGRFRMGSLKNFGGQEVDVTLTRGYFLSDREVSVRQFRDFLKDPDVPASDKPDQWKGYDDSIESVEEYPAGCTWLDGILFCNWLSLCESRTPYYRRTGRKLKMETGTGPAEFDVWEINPFGTGYRLPTEAEWEYACRARSTTDFCCGDDEQLLREYAVIQSRNSLPCGTRMPNAWGFFDMHGNYGEWCYDAAFNWPGGVDPVVPEHPTSPEFRVHRGGIGTGGASYCGSGIRTSSQAASRFLAFIGLRVALNDSTHPKTDE